MDVGVTVGFSQRQYQVQEGTAVLVCVEITSGILETDVFVFLSSIDGDAIGIIYTCIKVKPNNIYLFL